MLEFETWSVVMPKSALMVMVNWKASISTLSTLTQRMILRTYQWRKRIPRHKCNEKAQPRKEEDASILVERVEQGHRFRFPGYGVDFRRGEEYLEE